MIRSLAIRLIASLALMGHAFTLAALCGCGSGGDRSGQSMASMPSCHDGGSGLRVSELKACCCHESGVLRQGTEAANLTKDASLLTVDRTARPLLAVLPLGHEYIACALHRRGSSPPRPPLRV